MNISLPFRVLFCAYLLMPGALCAQTILLPGDLAILSVNANNRLCNPENSADDLVSFVCFKDIAPGTQIDFTDNGWERALPGRWGNSEGFVRMTRTGSVIPAGTVITLLFPPIGSNPYKAIAPDSNWTFQQSSFNSVNINSNGDQFYFMQGGVWDNIDSALVFLHRATYTGGRILFGFNTKAQWNAFINSSQESGLHPEVAACFHMEPRTGATDYIAYSGPTSPATQLAWIQRIAEPANWRAFNSCASMPVLPDRLDILPSGISLTCQTCRSCVPFDAGFRIQLPSTGGPFTVTLTNERDTFQRTGLLNGATFTLFADSTRSFRILSVEDSRGCPVFSDLGDPVRIVVERPAQPSGRLSLASCSSGDGLGTFALAARDTFFTKNRPGLQVRWFADSILQLPIASPATYTGPAGAVFATLFDGVCPSLPAVVELQLLPAPKATLPQRMSICAGAPCQILEIPFEGQAPFTLSYFLDIPDRKPISESRSFNSSPGPWAICPEQLGLDRGAMVIHYLSLSDASGCTTDLQGDSTIVEVGLPITEIIRQTLCPGETVRANGRVYDEANPRDTILLPKAASGGCDSLIIIDLSYHPAIFGGLTGDTAACPGQAFNLRWQLSGGERFRVIFREGETLRELQGLRDGDPLVLTPRENTLLAILSIQAEDSRCEIRPFIAVPLRLNNLAVSAEAIPKFGGAAVSCHGASDGEARVRIAGGVAPFQTSWSTSANTEIIRNLSASTYSVTVTDAQGCRAESRTTLTQPGPLAIDLEVNPARCAQDQSRFLLKKLSGGTGPFLYSLDRQTFQVLERLPLVLRNLSPGNYRFSLQDANGCTAEFPFDMPPPNVLNIDLGPNRTIRSGDSVRITPQFNFAPTSQIWTPKLSSPPGADASVTLAPRLTTTYLLEASDSTGCSTSAQLTIFIDQKEQFFTPSGFSPNGDNINDRMQFFLGPEVTLIQSLRVFNRWGTQVFEAQNGTPGSAETEWDGQINGKPAPVGVYAYTAVLSLRDGKTVQTQGEFTLIR